MGREAFAMTSTNYLINWSSLNSGGDDSGTSTNYILRDTLGEQAVGFSTSTNFSVSAGYRAGDFDASSLGFSLGTQDNASQASYTFFSATSAQVISAAASSFSQDDLLAVAENIGSSQEVSVGRVQSISGNVITVDRWDGATSTMSAVPSGGDDYVYRLSGAAASLGQLSASVVKTSITATQVTSNAANGYTVSVSEDGQLRVSTSTFVIDVSDGAVTAGFEEYGWRAFGQRATSTSQDYAFSTTSSSVQSSSALAAEAERIAIVYKAAVASNTPAGNYSHVVYYTVTANY
jgi:hypothetical protein